jgi:hypothetical protein
MPTPKRKPGPAPFFSSPAEMARKIDAYFLDCDSYTRNVLSKTGALLEINLPRRYTVAGLALYLGFAARTELADYAKDHPAFSDTIKRARVKMEAQRSEDLVDPETSNSRGITFDLVNNHGWHDKTEIENVTPEKIKQFIVDAGAIIRGYVPSDKRHECAAAVAALMQKIDDAN